MFATQKKDFESLYKLIKHIKYYFIHIDLIKIYGLYKQ